MVDEDVVVDKLRYINEYTDDLKQMRGLPRAEYLDDVVIQRAVERTLTTLLEACIDLAQHIRRQKTSLRAGQRDRRSRRSETPVSSRKIHRRKWKRVSGSGTS